MNKQELLFERLKEIKDYWVDTSIESLNEDADLVWSDYEEEYNLLRSRLTSKEEKEVFRKIVDELIKGVIHSFLVTIDGGDNLSEKYNLDLIDNNTKKSLKGNTALHEEFYNYLIDVE